MSDAKNTVVLVIDDEASIRDSFRDFLEDRGFTVLEAENGRLGLDVVEQQDPDLVMVDLRMPEIGGLEVLSKLSKQRPDTPTIVVSGTGVIADAIKAIHYGAWDYLLKPITDMSVLIHSVEKVLERARLKRENRLYRQHLEVLVAQRTRQITELNDRLKAIVGSTRTLTACSTTGQVIRQLLTEFANNMAAEGGSLYLLEEGQLILKHTIDKGRAQPAIPLPVPSNSVIGRALNAKEPLLIRDITDDQELLPSGGISYTNGSLLTIPFFDTGGDILGVVTLHNKTAPPFTEQDKEIGVILASHSCEAIKAARAVDSLEKSEEKYRQLVENMNDVHYMIDAEKKVTYISPAIERISGFTTDEIVGHDYQEFFLPVDQDHLETSFIKLLDQQPVRNEYKLLNKQGEQRWVRVSSQPITKSGQTVGIQGILSDITEAKLAAQQLEIRAQELAVLNHLGAEISADLNVASAVQIALDQVFTAIPADLAILFLKEKDELILKGVLPDNGDLTKEKLSVHQIGKCLCGLALEKNKPVFSNDICNDPRCIFDECKAVGMRSFAAFPLGSGDSRIGVLGIAASSVKDFVEQASFLEALAHGIASGLKNAMLFENATSDAAKLHQRLLQVQQAEKEKKELSRQLQQTQKMEAIGTLAGSIAHDFNNILGGIIGYTELVLTELSSESGSVRDKLKRVLDAGLRARDLVQQILQFSRKETNTYIALPLRPLVEEVLQLIRSTFPATIDIQHHSTAPHDHVMADSTQLHQVIMNICTNAYHAMRGKNGRLEVILENIHLDHLKQFLSMTIPPGEYIKISISDNGGGIPPGLQDRIFEPYYTTKSTDEGTGLGLSVSYGIILNHNGLLEIENTSEEGTTFAIYLPVTSSTLTEIATTGRSMFNGNGQKVMVVDDEVFFLDVMCEHIVSMNCRAMGFQTSLEALKEIKESPDGYDLIITDQTMPVMTGTQFISEVRKLDIQVPVILCTGFSETVTEQTAIHYGISKFLMKPVSRKALAAVLNELLASGGQST